MQPTKRSIGGIEGAQRTSRETANWVPQMRAPDNAINPVKAMADARSQDMSWNDGYATGAVSLHRDAIVGAEYRLNARPNHRALGLDETWAEEFQEVVEARFNVAAASESCWFDAQRRNTFTDLVRLAVVSFVQSGESIGTAEWVRDSLRPFRTAYQPVSPDRLDNPNGRSDDEFLRRGVERDRYGRPIAFWFRDAHPRDINMAQKSLTWTRVKAETPWGRRQVIYIAEQRLPDQTRGIADMVSVLKTMRMTKQFQEIVLQNAVVNATYAAAIESEMPTESVVAAMGGGQEGVENALGWYLDSLSNYLSKANNIALDGVKMPHLFPGTKLNLRPVGTPGGIGADFEVSLLRNIAAGLGLSYEEFARDYTKTNYSSARASMATTWRYMLGRKKIVADRFANIIYGLWLEEEIAAGNVPLPPGKDRGWFYEPLVKDALCMGDWIGAARGQIDEKKETEAAIMRIEAGLSTLEAECARLGNDYRDVLRQRARERRLMVSLGLPLPEAVQAAQAAPAAEEPDATDDEEPDTEESDDDA